LVVLEDTLGVQPVYEPAPIVRKSVIDEYPEIEELLKPVFLSLDLETLQMLNASIAVEGRDARDVASEYLRSKGFID
ncbi:MAG TPA: ABC transporter substrate-binding protein, partial [Kosmotogaceae bacterium]|nr:ABC transporter substrate-binding protein [Kosmotogaceae bacterium]